MLFFKNGTWQRYLQTIFVVFKILLFFFSFLRSSFFNFPSHGSYGRNFSNHFLWNYTTDPLPKLVCTPREYEALSKLFKELWNLTFWIFAIFFSISLTWDHIESKVWNYTSHESTHQNSCIFIGRVSTKDVKRIMKYQILNFWHFLFFSGRLTR